MSHRNTREMDGLASGGAPVTEGIPNAVANPELLGGGNQSTFGSPLREIHKVGCLKYIPARRMCQFLKAQKPEKVWVAFCLHNDKDAFLEFYDNCRNIAGHEPLSKFELSKCLHISPSLASEDEHFEFAITLVSHVVRLVAPSREAMVEWIDTIRTKLRDLGILEPKDNVYSGDPVPMQPSQEVHLGSRSNSTNEGASEEASTARDPNSPLPSVPALAPGPTPPPLPPRSASSSSTPVFTFDSASLPPTEARHGYQRSASLDSGSASSTSAHSSPAPEVPDRENGVYEPLFRPLVSVTRVNSWSSPSRPLHALLETCRNKRLSFTAPSMPNSYLNARPGPSNIPSEQACSAARDVPTGNAAAATSTSAAGAPPQIPTSTGQEARLPEESGQALTLKEAQVLCLRKEIEHDYGVRLIVRKRDCLHAVAFVECFGAVWIAGWNQKDHPLLHNVFHVGDRLRSVAGARVTTVQDVVRVIKSQGVTVEFVVHRLPHGRVFAIKRDVEGQELGLVRERGTPEIAEVKPGGLAAKHGLPLRATTVDGTSLCNWFLTEVNCRPLNLFFKNHEVQDRLNAVGKDISILVQPSDLVFALKKQLKSLRGYKEFIVQ
ncbi:uncharacterized protein LOC135377509 [Ornithodoros turicata]|uniref:uncharacterized protein LOC135377509 n=1 Tax=Ornithodoros turicata TaxID=34597 RepID=UPI00313912B3